jgi:hypothetical protein
LRVSDRFSCMIHHWKTRISRSIFVSVARQPDKHMPKYHARKLRCHLRVCQSQGALPVNELINCATVYKYTQGQVAWRKPSYFMLCIWTKLYCRHYTIALCLYFENTVPAMPPTADALYLENITRSEISLLWIQVTQKFVFQTSRQLLNIYAVLMRLF